MVTEERVKEVVSTVDVFLAENNRDDVDYNRMDENIFTCPEFLLRVQLAGMKLYKGMLNSGGELPGKTEMAVASNGLIKGMNDEERAIFIMCVFEATCVASTEYMAKGKMNAGLRKAADKPRN
jgi:hypothetical protein